MPLFVGLGNPGPEHAANRHNLGFLAVDTIALRHNAAPWRKRFQGEFCETSVGGTRVQLLKPLTYMNEAGRSVQDAVQFYKLAPEDVVVFHDELDLAPAKLRVKTGGGNAGHNGLRSVSAHIGNDYRRVRLGIGHPGVKDFVHQWVLSNFAKADRDWVVALCDAIADNADLLASGQDASFQNKVHLALDAKGFGDLPASPRDRTD